MDDNLWKHVKHFKRGEFDSKSPDGFGTGNKMDVRLVFALDNLRGLVDRPFRINSGYRTPEHNASVGGAPKSAHVEGLAVDIATTGWTERDKNDFIIYARKLGFNGVGIAKSFIHIDMKDRIASWIYPAGGGQKAIPIGDEYRYL